MSKDGLKNQNEKDRESDGQAKVKGQPAFQSDSLSTIQLDQVIYLLLLCLPGDCRVVQILQKIFSDALDDAVCALEDFLAQGVRS